MSFKIDEIRKENRKSVKIKFINNKIVLFVPLWFTKEKIDNVIKENKEKIEKAFIKWKKQTKKEFKNGDKIYYFGKEYLIKRISDKTNYLYFTGSNFILSANSNEKAKKLFEDLFRRKAKIYICNRANELANKYGFLFSKCKITRAKTRWGSCSNTNNINFSLYLIMANKEIIDYVIIHELAHTKEKNHSVLFWKIVREIVPNYKACQKWLKENISKLRF